MLSELLCAGRTPPYLRARPAYTPSLVLRERALRSQQDSSIWNEQDLTKLKSSLQRVFICSTCQWLIFIVEKKTLNWLTPSPQAI